jgi:hypothetical protein
MGINPGYSEEALVAALRNWWNDHVANKDDPFAEPVQLEAGTIFELIPAIDSLGVVSALVTVEKHLGFEIHPRIIKAGGHNFEEMIADLLPKIRALLTKKRKKEAA